MIGLAVGQDNEHRKPNAAERTYNDTKDVVTGHHASKPDVTYGRVKELTAGQKVVVDVDNAVDKSYDLTDKDEHVVLASGLKVGDPVKITETHANGKKTVHIARNTANVKHGDKTRAEERRDSDKNHADRTK